MTARLNANVIFFPMTVSLMYRAVMDCAAWLFAE
jgi:hypothetical protein